VKHKKNDFKKHAGLLSSGTFIGQIVVVASSPLITRLYSPADLGVLGVVSSLLVTLSVVGSLQYQNAIPIVDSNRSVVNIVSLCTLIALFYFFALIAVLIKFQTDIVDFFNLHSVEEFVWLLPIGVFLLSLFQILRFLGIRYKEFEILAKIKIVQPVSMTVIQVLGFKFGAIALILGQIVGRSAGIFTLISKFSKLLIENKKHIYVKEIANTAVVHLRYPKFATLGTLLNELGTYLPIFMLSALSNPTSTGYYVIAHRAMAIPMTTIGVSIAEVFFASVREDESKGKLNASVLKLNRTLSSVSLPIIIALMILAPTLFSIVFGKNWIDAGKFVQLLAPMLYAQLITFPLSGVMVLKKRDRDRFLFQFIMTVLRFVAIYTGMTCCGVFYSIFLFSLVSTICYLAYLLHILNLCGVDLLDFLVVKGRSVLYSVIVVSPLLFSLFMSDKVSVLSFLFFVVLLLIRYAFILQEFVPIGSLFRKSGISN